MSLPPPPRPPYPPPDGGAPEESDETLAARLRGRPEGEAAHSVALLMARHWQPVQDYAGVCLAATGSVAAMAAAAAFHQVFDRLTYGEHGVALRPRLLLTVRDTIREWSAEERISGVLPDLEKPSGGRAMRSAKYMTPENRKLAERSFQTLQPFAQCLLWHTEVEAETITVPAALLGMDTDTASAALQEAREKFREGCVRAHRELAPTNDCRFYNRLLDVPIRRGGALLPDVQQHLAQCRYCRFAAEQLSYFEGGLGGLLAEAVLGWGARPYLASRPGRGRPDPRTRTTGRHGGHSAGGTGRHRLLSRLPAPGRRIVDAARSVRSSGSSRSFFVGAGLIGAGVVASVVAVSLWPDHGGTADPVASTSGSGHVSASASGAARLPAVPGQTRLRNAAADLCLDIRGTVKAGADTVLAACSSAETQEWSYGTDGLLRSAADSGLCLDSHADAGVVVLGTCADANAKRGNDVRYDLTVRGELLPRWDSGLALTSTTKDPGADIVLKIRDGSTAQRWGTDSVSASPGSLSIAGTGAPSARPAHNADRLS
ncbi:Ricin-type beta-trefoil lectin domain-containing protein [Streptomyces sp. 3213]|uniref:RICIN domain-containing protein n=1 Tax=Streptomyces sp. 3213.3 TaxID=1855348 RepID=UPI00089CFBA6|nr:RICIN domain-containing protein [Streptomyces sp. 3213.3]SEC62686.1 Ricin-type beta-trefoil lectin domain-containing protein [Streptomyces sp. 3213] [Streptomyces sp. 3213.3]